MNLKLIINNNKILSIMDYTSVINLSMFMGNPYNEENIFSFKNTVALDEKESFPHAAVNLLNQWGMQNYYVPVEYGGSLKSFEELIALIATIARYDLTLAVAHGKTFLGSAAVWICGNNFLKSKVAKMIKDGQAFSLGVTEKDHGSDLISSEVFATNIEGGYHISGEKWLINNATRGSALTLFAKVSNERGPFNFSLFMIDKTKLDAQSFSNIPKIKTHGIRGADISGISFNNAFVPKSSLMGKIGSGLEDILKCIQLTRTICSGLSFGAGDSALRTTIHFAKSRKLYDQPITSLEHTCNILLNAFLDLLICDCVIKVTSRALHIIPEQMSVYSAVIKYFVPSRVETMVLQLAKVLGARHFLRQEHDNGIFQKILRDISIISIFDSSSIVNLQSIGQQLKQLSEANASLLDDAKLKTLFTLNTPLNEFNLNSLLLNNYGRDDILHSIDKSLQLIKMIEVNNISLETKSNLIILVQEIISIRNKFYLACKNEKGLLEKKLTSIMHKYAAQYALLYAASSCIQIWLYNRAELEGYIKKGEWLVLCLSRLCEELQGDFGEKDLKTSCEKYKENILDVMFTLFEHDRLFSIVPLPI